MQIEADEFEYDKILNILKVKEMSNLMMRLKISKYFLIKLLMRKI